MENYSFLSVPRGGYPQICILASRLNFLNFFSIFPRIVHFCLELGRLEMSIFASNWEGKFFKSLLELCASSWGASKWAFLPRVGVSKFFSVLPRVGCLELGASNWVPRVVHFCLELGYPIFVMPRTGCLELACLELGFSHMIEVEALQICPVLKELLKMGYWRLHASITKQPAAILTILTSQLTRFNLF